MDCSYRPQKKLREGNVFTGVCDSVHSGGGLALGGGFLLPRGDVPGGDPPWTATGAGGTHPTGMHSCCKLIFIPLTHEKPPL